MTRLDATRRGSIVSTSDPDPSSALPTSHLAHTLSNLSFHTLPLPMLPILLFLGQVFNTVYSQLGHAIRRFMQTCARVDLLAYLGRLVPQLDLIVFDKAVRSGQRATAMRASFGLDSLVAFRLKALTGRLPTRAQAHVYWPRRVPSLLCVLCGALNDQDHWCLCPSLRDALWECGVALHDQVELLLCKHGLAAHTQSAHALVDLLLAGHSLRATAACAIDLSVRHCFPALAPVLPRIVTCASSTIWQVVWKRRCELVGPIGDEDLEATQCLCDICRQARPAARQRVMSPVDVALVDAHYLHECHVGTPPILGRRSTTLSPAPLSTWQLHSAFPGLAAPPFGFARS